MVGGQRTALWLQGRDEYSRHPPADRSAWPGRVLIPTYPPKPLKRRGACVRFYRPAGNEKAVTLRSGDLRECRQPTRRTGGDRPTESLQILRGSELMGRKQIVKRYPELRRDSRSVVAPRGSAILCCAAKMVTASGAREPDGTATATAAIAWTALPHALQAPVSTSSSKHCRPDPWVQKSATARPGGSSDSRSK